MMFVFTVLRLLFLPILSFKEIKPTACVNCKHLIEDNIFRKLNKYSLFIKEEVRDIFSLMNDFEKIYKTKCILNMNENENANENADDNANDNADDNANDTQKTITI